MKKTKPCSRKEHNGEVRGSVLRKAYQVRKTSNFIFFFLHKENVKKTEKGKYVFLLHVLKIHRPGKWYIIACFLYLRFDWLRWNLIFLRRIMEFLSKYQKKKKKDQQTAVFLKLIFLSYSDVLLSNFLPRLVAITHSQSLTIVLQRDRIIEQIFFNNQGNCNKWISFVIGQSKGTNASLLIVPSISLSRITKKNCQVSTLDLQNVG